MNAHDLIRQELAEKRALVAAKQADTKKRALKAIADGGSASVTCAWLGISRTTLNRWLRESK